MASLKQKHEEAFENFKETLETLSSLTSELTSNILLHTQVVAGPFDARKVDFDALYEINMDQLGFDARFPSGAAWDGFASKWKKYFYLDEGPSESVVVPTNDNATIAAIENIEVVEGEGEIARDLEGGGCALND